jgi:hypothetical protein
LFALAALGALCVAIYIAGPIWLRVISEWVVPPHRRTALTLSFLSALLVGYLIVAFLLVAAVSAAVLRAWAARLRSEQRPKWIARFLAGAAVYVATLLVLEAGSAIYYHRSRVIPQPAEAREIPPSADFTPTKTDELTQPDKSSIYIVVLGESSARGEPYHDWLSVGQIVGWELERVFPDRKIEVDIRAEGGAPLKPNHRILFEELTRRPDAVVIYSGHNEFQSRFRWSRPIPYYADDFATRPTATTATYLGRLTPLCRFISDTIEYHSISRPPPRKSTAELIDRPICSAEEWSQILEEFHQRLESMVAYSERLGALPILIIPAGNDVDFEPSKSLVSANTTRDQRIALALEFRTIRVLEDTDPARALDGYQRFLKRQPGFAEAHYRLARLLAAEGKREQANHHFVMARDLDGLPLRCPSQFQAVYREIAAQHQVILIDSQSILGSLSPSGLPDRYVIHDGQHPSLAGYVALSQVVLDRLAAKGAFGWPRDKPPPLIDAEECASRAGMTPSRWGKVCNRVAFFFELLANTRFDPESRLQFMEQWRRAESAVRAGAPPETARISGLGVHPDGVRALDRERFRSTSPQPVAAN